MIGDLRNYYRALDSVKIGKRLPEANYTVLCMHSQSQLSIKSFAQAPLRLTTNIENIDKLALETITEVDSTGHYTKVSD